MIPLVPAVFAAAVGTTWKVSSWVYEHREELAGAWAKIQRQATIHLSGVDPAVAQFLMETFPGMAEVRGKTGVLDVALVARVKSFLADPTQFNPAQVGPAIGHDIAVNWGLLDTLARHRRATLSDATRDDRLVDDPWPKGAFLVGGPPSNPLAQTYLTTIAKRLGERFEFSRERPWTFLGPNGLAFSPTMPGGVETCTLDYGVLARLPSLMQPQHNVVLAMGPTRYGTEAAAAALTRPDLWAEKFLDELNGLYAGKSFYAVVAGKVEKGRLTKVELQANDVIPSAAA